MARAILAFLFPSALGLLSSCTFHLSLSGSDAADGVTGAFATLPRAHAAAAAAASSGCASVAVIVGGGTWAGPWEFPPAPRAAITYRGATSGPPTVISGGLEVANFSASPSGLWVARLPAGVNATQLFVGGARRPRARLPNVVGDAAFAVDAFSAASMHKWAAPLCPACANGDPINGEGLVFSPGDGVDASWDFSAARVNLFTAPWGNCVVRVRSVDPANHTILFQGGGCGSYGLKAFPGYETGQRWLVENVRGALDAPGEWFLNTTTGLLEYYPLPGEALGGFTATLAQRGSLLVVSQDGLAFEDLSVVFSATDASGSLSGFSQSGAVEVAARGVALRRLTVARSGGNCVVLRPGVADFVLANATLLDCGGHGVFMDTQDEASDVIVTDTRIYGVGYTYLSQPTGILLNGGGNISAVHNEIVNSSYTGISVAWLHGGHVPLVPAPYRFNVSFNRVAEFGRGVLSDFGGVRIAINNADVCFLTDSCYIPTLVRNNVITGGRHFAYGAVGLYTDNAVAGVDCWDNIVADVDSMAYQPHCGVNNTLVNNLVFDARGERAGNCSIPGTPTISAVIYGCEFGWNKTTPAPFAASVKNNIIVATRCALYTDSGIWPNQGPNYPGNFAATNFSSDRNVYWAAPGALPLRFPQGTSFEEWRALSGNDGASVVSDPLLRDPARGDFSVLPNSPAWALGWRAIDTSNVGPR
jgi:hypothetical protein